MKISVFNSRKALGEAAADRAAAIIRQSVRERGRAYLVAATGASQFDFLEALTKKTDIDWRHTTLFHLDEYVGLPESHPASFRKYLRERIVDKVNPGTFHFIDGDGGNASDECRRLGDLISRQPIDAAFVGIGENGHLAFNDPPADFETEKPYLVVELDEACRRQQVGEGWFKTIEEVPRRAISMSIRQILKSGEILCIVPEQRKAGAVRDCCELEISPERPASALRLHQNVTLYLDRYSASLLSEPPPTETNL
jgi:glucosamine-6-phosphate deaminase